MLSLIITLVVLGLVLYLLNTLPIAEQFKTVVYILAVLWVILILLNAAGGTFGSLRL